MRPANDHEPRSSRADTVGTGDELNYLRTAFNDSDDALIVCSPDGVMVTWNRGAMQIYGYTHEEAVGRHRSFLIPPEEHETQAARWVEIVAGLSVKNVETRRVAKGGREILVSSTISPISDAPGHITGVLGISRDITDIRRTEYALAEVYAEATEASRVKSEFIANMNHELQTPMNGVIGMARLLAGTKLDHQQRAYLADLEASSDSLLSLITGMLEFSQLQSGSLTLVERPFDPRQLFEEVRLVARNASPNFGVTLVVRSDAALPARVNGDRERLRQVLLNLTGNALKFTSVGEVVILVRWADSASNRQRLRVEVSDTGIGLEASAQETIFRSFTQVDGSLTRSYGGAGLGLTTAKELVELMGGKIGVRSAPGAGSTFWFTLPLRDALHQIGP
jgi:two-component system, sensor histidine kinase and response regulator